MITQFWVFQGSPAASHDTIWDDHAFTKNRTKTTNTLNACPQTAHLTVTIFGCREVAVDWRPTIICPNKPIKITCLKGWQNNFLLLVPFKEVRREVYIFLCSFLNAIIILKIYIISSFFVILRSDVWFCTSSCNSMCLSPWFDLLH